MRARFRLDLADRFATFGYGPAFRRKPFRPHLTMGALSCTTSHEGCHPNTTMTGNAR